MPRTKHITRLAEKAKAIEYSLRRNREAAAEALARKYPAPIADLPPSETESLRALDAESGTAPDWRELQAFIAREMEAARLRLRQASRAYVRELQDDPRSLERRDEVVQEVYQQMIHVRHVLEHAIGETAAYDLLGISGPTPRRPPDLLDHIRTAAVQLRDPAKVPEDLSVPGMLLSWEDLATAMERDAVRLAEVIDDYREEEKGASLARFEKDQVMASVNDTYVGFTRVLEGLYIAAGMRPLAEQLRLTIPTSSGKRNEEPEVEEPEVVLPETGAPDAPEPPSNDDQGQPLPVAAAGGARAGTGDVGVAVARPGPVRAPDAVKPSDDES